MKPIDRTTPMRTRVIYCVEPTGERLRLFTVSEVFTTIGGQFVLLSDSLEGDGEVAAIPARLVFLEGQSGGILTLVPGLKLEGDD